MREQALGCPGGLSTSRQEIPAGAAHDPGMGMMAAGCEQSHKDTVQGLKAQASQTLQSSAPALPPCWRCPQGRVP